jgi:hypothetical protein
MAQKVLASWFDDKIGYRDNNLYDGGYYYAELSKDYKKKDFSALGNLPYRQKLKITYKGKSVIAYKADVGSGGPSHPKIDLHINLAKALNFDLNKGLDYVTIQKV